jgi:ABC-2 type transport system permease protein
MSDRLVPDADIRPQRTVTRAPRGWRAVESLGAQVGTFCIVEVEKLAHDPIELLTRAIQPALWMLIFGQTFNRLHAIPTGSVPYLAYLAPGIVAQSALFISIFYGIQIIWDRDAGILSKLMVTPTPHSALIAGKAFAAGIRALSQVVVVTVIALFMGVHIDLGPLNLLGVAAATVLGAAFFSCLSMTIAGIVKIRDRLMGIGQAITMPLFFASNALYPIDVMPTWLRVLSRVNPLSYEVDALRGLMIDTSASLGTDFAVLVGTAALGILGASWALGRLVR